MYFFSTLYFDVIADIGDYEIIRTIKERGDIFLKAVKEPNGITFYFAAAKIYISNENLLMDNISPAATFAFFFTGNKDIALRSDQGHIYYIWNQELY